jgi:hypothetical protein
LLLGCVCISRFWHILIINNTVKELDSTVLLRILTMYMQIYGIISTFDVIWPSLIGNLLSIVSFGGQAAEQALYSVDCLLLHYGVNSDDLYITKLVVVSLIPICGGIIAGIFYLILFIITNNTTLFTRQYIVTLTVIYYLMYPPITKFTLNLLSCVDLDDGIFLKYNTNIKCWNSRHTQWVIFIGLPITAVWIIGIPVAILLLLKWREDELDDEKNLRAFGFWYTGLKRRGVEKVDDGKKVKIVKSKLQVGW